MPKANFNVSGRILNQASLKAINIGTDLGYLEKKRADRKGLRV
jgi:hypothetical protein